jgi:hypothetical protein
VRVQLALELVVKDKLGQVWRYIRPNGKCPASEFLNEECEEKIRKRFKDSFGAAVQLGSDYMIHERFHPLHDDGRPLWEFKEHKHRLFCQRTVTGKSINIILFNGWKKDKDGRGKKEEEAQIQRAQNLLNECRQLMEERRK